MRHAAPLLLAIAACGGGGGFVDAGAHGGTIAFTWKLVDANQMPLTCTQVGAESVQVTINNLKNGGTTLETFSCDAGMAHSNNLLDGSYRADFVLTTGGTKFSTGSSSNTLDISGGASVPTMSTFVVDATGAVKLHLAATGTTAGNCAATGAGGAGIMSTTITVRRNDTGPCTPVTFTIGAGATQPAGSYAFTDCTTPVVGPCIDSDQELDATGLISGRTTFTVKANTGTANCWSKIQALQVPALGASVSSTITLDYATGAPGC